MQLQSVLYYLAAVLAIFGGFLVVGYVGVALLCIAIDWIDVIRVNRFDRHAERRNQIRFNNIQKELKQLGLLDN
jgi:hypothetical protein